MKTRTVVTAAFLVGFTVGLQAQTRTLFDPPNSLGTTVSAVNSNRAVAGWFVDGSANNHGFVRDAGGTVTVFDAPGGPGTTQVWSINDRGDVSGTGPFGGGSSFVRTAAGVFTTFTVVPFYTYGNELDIIPYSLNNLGDVAGYTISGNVVLGFVRHANGQTTSFDAGKAGYTIVTSINDNGDISGMFRDADGVIKPFARANGGAFVTVTPPSNKLVTSETNINALGQVAGTWQDNGNGGNAHGFVWSLSGHSVGLTLPITCARAVAFMRINNVGQVLGACTDTRGNRQTFLLRADGSSALIAGVPPNIDYYQTMNDSGDLAGMSATPAGVLHGLVLYSTVVATH